ncbi:hypothetical protein AWN88_07130 [Agrobacterium tumefaciens]|nr:hypothetical protein AWN88_07130 [Agrobacterium tumefaciens]KAJ35296.1 hypothetical protein BW45_29405 [Agrobacterium tumefaciens]
METRFEMRWGVEAAEVAAWMKAAASMETPMKTAATKVHSWHTAAETASGFCNLRRDQCSGEQCAEEKTWDFHPCRR